MVSRRAMVTERANGRSRGISREQGYRYRRMPMSLKELTCVLCELLIYKTMSECGGRK